MSLVRRWLTVGLLVVIAMIMAPGIISAAVDFQWRLVALFGVVTAVSGVRTLLGPIVVIDSGELVIQKNWPFRRRIPLNQINGIDVVQGFWNLEVELESGERVVLPCVEHLDALYEDLSGQI